MTNSTLTAILGNTQQLDGGAMFGNVPRPMWAQWLTPDEQGRIPLACRCMLIESHGKRILCEAGIGAFFEPKLASRYGVIDSSHKLIDNLQQLNLSDRDIDYVILSHLHFDHAGGILPSWSDSQGGHKGLLFPNAKYVVGREAFERAEHPHARDRASFIEDMPGKLKASNRLILVDGDTHPDVMPDRISFFYSHGHTPGQMHTVFKGDHRTVIFAGDLIPGRAWIHLPVTMGYDRFAEKVIDEKSELYQRIADHKDTWLFFTHDDAIAAATIHKNEKGRFVADEVIASPEHWPL